MCACVSVSVWVCACVCVCIYGPTFATLTDATTDMINSQEELCQRAAALRQAADDIHIASQDRIITIFETGTYVLIQYTDRPPTRLHTKWAGPYKVLGHQNSEYKLLDLVTNKEKLVHNTRIVRCPMDLPHED